jgi:hypothetical protein
MLNLTMVFSECERSVSYMLIYYFIYFSNKYKGEYNIKKPFWVYGLFILGSGFILK